MNIIFSRCSHFLIVGLALCACYCDADPSISTSTPTPCYGDVVTLVCHHPELASNPEKYFSTVPTWREDDVGITPIPGTMFEAYTPVEPTHTNLTINITMDHFGNKSFNYSCLLVLAENGLPSGEVKTSENVTVDPVDQAGPPEVTIITTVYNITLTWNTALRCFESEMFTFVVIWNEIGSGTSSNVTTSSSPYTISGLQPGTSYQISVQGVGRLGVVGGTKLLNATTSSLDSTFQSNLPTILLSVCLPIGLLIVLIIGTVTVVVLVRWLRRKCDHGLHNAIVALFQKTSCYYKKEVNSDNDEDIKYSSRIPVQATQSPTTGQDNDPMRSADSNVHLPGYNHQLVSEGPSPLPQEIKEAVCVGYIHTRISGYNSFGMENNHTADCVSIGQSHNWVKGSDFALLTENKCSMTVFVVQWWNHLLPNFNMPDTLEYSWNI